MKSFVVAADMGYGHQRAAFALKDIAAKQIINASSYEGMPRGDKLIWAESRILYETVSRFTDVPVIGDVVFGIFDKFQTIKEFYPKTQAIEHPTLQLKQIYGLIEKRNWGRHLIEKLNKEKLPIVATFPAVAFMAEYFAYQGPLWLVVTDADVSRAWAPINPSKTKIRYCASTEQAARRLLRYGVPGHNIFLTGFPLPNTLTKNAKKDTFHRLQALDPQGRYGKFYSDLAKRYLGQVPVKPKRPLPLSLTFAVGGAGAQADIGKEILVSLAPWIREKKARVNLVAGTHEKTAADFKNLVQKLRLTPFLGKEVQIVFAKTLPKYFQAFNTVLRKTDILWTKPSELIFYGALGIPVVLTTPLGSQEQENRKWLLSLGAGIDQVDPKICRSWIADFLAAGNFAEAAMQGFVEMEKAGAENIANLVSHS